MGKTKDLSALLLFAPITFLALVTFSYASRLGFLHGHV
jgi:hypothetical protein